MTDDKWDLTFDIDLKSMIRLARAVASPMKAQNSRAIICITSIMSVAYVWDEHVHYSAAKAGVVGLIRGLAVELAGHGLRVNGIARAISGLRRRCPKSTRLVPQHWRLPQNSFR